MYFKLSSWQTASVRIPSVLANGNALAKTLRKRIMAFPILRPKRCHPLYAPRRTQRMIWLWSANTPKHIRQVIECPSAIPLSRSSVCGSPADSEIALAIWLPLDGTFACCQQAVSRQSVPTDELSVQYLYCTDSVRSVLTDGLRQRQWVVVPPPPFSQAIRSPPREKWQVIERPSEIPLYGRSRTVRPEGCDP